MKTTLTRLFTVALLMMVSLGAKADVKVLFGEKGTELQPAKNGTITLGQKELTGGTIIISQEEQKDGTTKVTFAVTPDNGYTMAKDGIELYATIPANAGSTRAPEVSAELTPQCDDFKGDTQKRTYYVNIDSKLALWVKSADFQPQKRDGAKGTTPPLGFWYIANDKGLESETSFDYNTSTTAERFYIVPAKDPVQPDERDAYYSENYDTSDGDPEKPYLTTYRTNRDVNSAWVIKSAGNNKYFLIHVLTGKYAVYHTTPDCTSKSHRKVIHLETLADPENVDIAKFYIENGTTTYTFRPQSLSTNNRFFNPSNGNKELYHADGGDCNNAGLIGVFSDATNRGSKWHLESALLPAPTIEYDSENNKFIISYDQIPEGYTLLYTTDGSEPTIGGSTTHTYTNESEITLETIGDNPLKAVVVRYGLILTETAIIRKPASPTITPTPGDCNNTVTISTEEGTSVYYTINGTDPTNSSTLYTGPFVLNSDATIKAVAYSGNLHSDIISLDYSPNYSNRPTIIQNGATITIEGTGTFYYTLNGDDPTTGSTQYSNPFTLSGNNGDVITIKAVAKDGDKELSCVVEKSVKMGYFISDLTSLEAISSHLGDLCILTDDIDASSLSASISGFTGEFDGGYYTISGLKKPLFDNLNGATVKNVLLDPNATVSGNGAICNEAEGSTKIYNCGVLSGTISGSGNVGGLVGHIKSGSSVRVVNCYNFATVSGGSTMAGIVGNNEGTVGDVRIAMCMMYGNMSGGTSPVYAGNHDPNVQNYTEYNYWRSKANLTYTTYNDQLAIDKDDYLTRFPFYRHILNTHRELAAFFLFGESDETVNEITANEVAEIGHWVLNKDLAPYPIVEEWKTNTKRTTVDIANNLPDTTEKGAGKLLNDIGDDGYYSGTGTNITKITAMGKNGYLTVNVSINGSDYSASLPITDMNEANYDYTWGKVVLPFANEFNGWTRDYSKVCTGWEITSITGGTAGTFANYNVSDRDCTAKDLYSNSGYIFAQGGNYIVPYGVTAINIKAHFANAFYLSDASYDVGYSANFDSPEPLGGNVSTSYHEKPVYTDLSTLVNALSTTTNPHDQAIVLVGNYHYNINTLGGSILNTGKAVTIMSTDEDCNQEPDYGWYTCNTSGRLEVPPLRFDFVPNIEMGMSSRVGSSLYPGIGIWHTRGWFELTETCVSNMSQCEINSSDFTYADNGKGNNRWIANSGCFVQIVRARDGNCTKLSYIQIGGNAYVKELYPGSHTDNARESATVPIAVTGGQVDECYMTGYKAGATLTGNMIYFWCGGGKIKKFLGAYLENPNAAGITAKVDHALIGRFFGGGTSAVALIKGDIDITINNSQVDFYCGGPEFGNMVSEKGVTTHAIGTTFGEYYGAGFGGTSITYNREQQNNSLNITDNATTTYDLGFSKYYKRLTNKTDYGIGCCYKFEYIFHSNGSNGVTRFYTGYAQFDLATTGNVTNVLNYCTIKKLPGTNSPTPKESTGEFYGAGCQGKVNGTVTSTLTNCTVERNAFGGGYKAESNEVEVYTTTQPSYSVYTKETGIFSDFGEFPTPEPYTWVHGDNDAVGTGDDAGKLFTSKILTELGNVTGNIELTINGGYVGGTAQGATPEVPATTTTDAIPAGGCVYGGGNESKSLSNATVTLKGDAVIYGDVFGGGNKADVQGSATVNIQQ